MTVRKQLKNKAKRDPWEAVQFDGPERAPRSDCPRLLPFPTRLSVLYLPCLKNGVITALTSQESCEDKMRSFVQGPMHTVSAQLLGVPLLQLLLAVGDGKDHDLPDLSSILLCSGRTTAWLWDLTRKKNPENPPGFLGPRC